MNTHHRKDPSAPHRARQLLACAFGVLGLAQVPAWAAVTPYIGFDIMATVASAHPNSTAAAASFDTAAAALGTVSLVTFETAPLGAFTNLTIAPGVTLSGADYGGVSQTVRNTSNFPAGPTLDGYNTTAGGSFFVEIQGGTLTFTFANAIQAFGAYFSGVQTNFFADTVSFSDGSSQTLAMLGAGTSNTVGGLNFVGFTDAGKSITSITINAGSASTGADFIGVDDVRFVLTNATIPEPSSLALVLAAGLTAGFASKRQKR